MTSSPQDPLLARAAAWLAEAQSLFVLTGAGVSRESGIPTFREARKGLWARFDPEQLASRAGFDADPALVWRWYRWRKARVRAASPNPAHHAIAALERRVADFTLATQNVDGLHRRAGSRAPLELHGSLDRVRCERCGQRLPWEEVPEDLAVPRCACGGRLRPDVVWFHEPLDTETLAQALAAATRAELCLAVGTSGVVQPAASLPLVAKRAGARLLVIDPGDTVLGPLADLWLRERAGRCLPALLRG